MEDFDRGDVLCWHSTLTDKVKLYDCTDPEHTTPKATASRHCEQFTRETVVYYHGSGQFSVPVTDRDSDMYGGATSYTVGPCEHRHETIEAAERCGARLTAVAVAQWNHDHGIGA